jgi:hypothetical protein
MPTTAEFRPSLAQSVWRHLRVHEAMQLAKARTCCISRANASMMARCCWMQPRQERDPVVKQVEKVRALLTDGTDQPIAFGQAVPGTGHDLHDHAAGSWNS